MQSDQLAALLAVIDHGTFDAAAAALHVTPSAISQRIKALELSTGRVLVQRVVPCRTTDAGRILLRVARQLQTLQVDAQAALGDVTALTDLPLAVNADSLATWFRPVLAAVGDWGDATLRLFVQDQGHSSALLRDGSVLGAVTSDPMPVNGCSVERLGTMRYLPVATPALRGRYAKGRSVDWAAMPTLRFNEMDDLQDRILAMQGVPASAAPHQIPSAEGFAAAIRAGLGWGLLPTQQLGDDLRTGVLVRLSREHIDVPLHWQTWRLRSARIDRVSTVIRAAAAASLTL